MELLQKVMQTLKATAWDKGSFRNYYYVSVYNDKQLNGCLECEFNELEKYDHARLTAILEALPQLDAQAHAHIQAKFPADDAGELELSDLMLTPDGAFKLGYYTGRTPMGETYLYVAFNADYSMRDDILAQGY